MSETSKMVEIRVVLIYVLYQPEQFYITFLEQPVEIFWSPNYGSSNWGSQDFKRFITRHIHVYYKMNFLGGFSGS